MSPWTSPAIPAKSAIPFRQYASPTRLHITHDLTIQKLGSNAGLHVIESRRSTHADSLQLGELGGIRHNQFTELDQSCRSVAGCKIIS